MFRSSRGLGVVFAVVIAIGGAAPALAIVSPDGGSTATKSGTTFSVKDSKCDGRAAYGNWGGTSANRLDNKSGCNTTASKTVTVGSFRACTDIPAGTDSCSVWTS